MRHPATTTPLRHADSRALLDRAVCVTPGGVNTARRKIHPSLCVALGRGAYVEDLDGNRYHAAYGTVLLSHSFAAVNERFKAVIDHQVLFGVGTSEVQVAVAEKIVEQLA